MTKREDFLVAATEDLLAGWFGAVLIHAVYMGVCSGRILDRGSAGPVVPVFVIDHWTYPDTGATFGPRETVALPLCNLYLDPSRPEVRYLLTQKGFSYDEA